MTESLEQRTEREKEHCVMLFKENLPKNPRRERGENRIKAVELRWRGGTDAGKLGRHRVTLLSNGAV